MLKVPLILASWAPLTVDMRAWCESSNLEPVVKLWGYFDSYVLMQFSQVSSN